jgi:hypothetical protein
MIDRILRRAGLTAALGLVLAATPALAINEVYESSCAPVGDQTHPCVKLPKENLCFRQIGDYDANGAGAQASGTLAKGKKGTMLKVDMTYEWFTMSAQFRPFTLKLNGKFPINFTILNHLDSCGNGACTRTATTWFDIDAQEQVYPGQFYGQPLTITLDSAKAADAGSSYNVTICAQTLKKK